VALGAREVRRSGKLRWVWKRWDETNGEEREQPTAIKTDNDRDRRERERRGNQLTSL